MKTKSILNSLEEESSHAEDKIFVVSFPKSGRTWLRVLLSRYKQRLLGLDDFHLKLHAFHSEKPVKTPQFIFYHANSSYHSQEASGVARLLDSCGWLPLRYPYPFSLEYCRGSRLIFLLRDPRDVVVSYFHQLSKREERVEVSSPANFARRRLVGIHRIIAFMNFVAEQQAEEQQLHIYYEDLHASPEKELEKVLQFAEMPIRPAFIQESIEYARFENMRKLELSGSQGDKLQAVDESNPDTFKTRKGKVGSYREELPRATVAYIDRVIARELHPFYARYLQPPVINSAPTS